MSARKEKVEFLCGLGQKFTAVRVKMNKRIYLKFVSMLRVLLLFLTLNRTIRPETLRKSRVIKSVARYLRNTSRYIICIIGSRVILFVRRIRRSGIIKYVRICRNCLK